MRKLSEWCGVEDAYAGHKCKRAAPNRQHENNDMRLTWILPSISVLHDASNVILDAFADALLPHTSLIPHALSLPRSLTA